MQAESIPGEGWAGYKRAPGDAVVRLILAVTPLLRHKSREMAACQVHAAAPVLSNEFPVAGTDLAPRHQVVPALPFGLVARRKRPSCLRLAVRRRNDSKTDGQRGVFLLAVLVLVLGLIHHNTVVKSVPVKP